KRPNKMLNTLSTSDRRNRNRALAYGLSLIAAAILCFSFQLNYIGRAEQSVNWPTTTGRVSRCEVVYRRKLDGSANMQRNGKLDLRYKYVVQGKDYISNQYQIFGPLPPNSVLEKIAESHPVDSSTKVFYNPQNPADSCLKPGCTIDNPFELAGWISGGLLAVGLLLVMFALGKKVFLKFLEPPESIDVHMPLFVNGILHLSKITKKSPFIIACYMVTFFVLLVILFRFLFSR
ncbi:MAG: DUF3592 domain-containing protein, partial [Candidatus Obscuribacterales bacterium]|nr:DUF3592 domain-containing protein [Candidatus Obscuribacterales bacterium]